MPNRSSPDAQLRRVVKKHGPLVRTSQLQAAGLHPRVIYSLRDAGVIEAVARGVFRIRSEPLPEHFDLLVVAKRAPQAVVCLISALAFHDLTDEIPHEVSIAVPRNAGVPVFDTTPVRVFRFSDAMYRLGIEEHRVGDIELKVYSPAKSIIDAFRFRNRIGDDVAVKALAAGLRTRKVRPGPLLELASRLRAGKVIAPYLNALS